MDPRTPVGPQIDADMVLRQLLAYRQYLNTIDQVQLGALINESILAAQADFEKDLRIFLSPRIIKTFPGPNDVYDLVEPQFDFYLTAYRVTGWFTTRHRPVTSVESVRVEYGQNNTLLTYPADWIRLNKMLGQITIVPIMGTVTTGQTLGLLPLVYWLPMLSGMALNGVVPQFVSIDYTAGIPDLATNPDWSDLRLALAKASAANVIHSILGLLEASVSRDGVSVGYINPMVVLQNLLTQTSDFKRQFKKKVSPILMQVA